MEPKFDKRFIDEAVQEVLNEITREEAINAFKEWIERDKKIEYADRLENIEIYKLAIKALEQTKPERKMGKWIENKWGEETCSECGYTHKAEGSNYCPNCGAKMEV